MLKYHKLQDKEWLYKVYIDDKLGAPDIAKIVGCKNTVVYNMLKHHNIETRSKRESQVVRYKDDNFVINLPVIEGGLLGDAMLRCQGKQKGTHESSQPIFRRKNKFKDHVEWVAEQLCGDWGLNHVKDVSDYMFTGAWCQCYEFCTRSHESLMEIYDRWYPASNNFKKLIPRDFELCEISLLHWFLDDGSSSYDLRSKKGIKRIRLTLCSECFSLDDQNFLVNQLNSKWNLNATVGVYKTKYRIFIPSFSSNEFFKIIGECPVESLKYKWKIT